MWLSSIASPATWTYYKPNCTGHSRRNACFGKSKYWYHSGWWSRDPRGFTLRKAKRPHNPDWAVQAFRITASGIQDQTQVHTHRCYSESTISSNILWPGTPMWSRLNRRVRRWRCCRHLPISNIQTRSGQAFMTSTPHACRAPGNDVPKNQSDHIRRSRIRKKNTWKIRRIPLRIILCSR